MGTTGSGPTRTRQERSLVRALAVQAVGVGLVIALVCGLLAAGTSSSQRDAASTEAAIGVADQATSDVAPDVTRDTAASTGSADGRDVVDITGVQTVGAFSDYWTCVGMVGGQSAYWIITKQLWSGLPPWVWAKVRAACWRFIYS